MKSGRRLPRYWRKAAAGSSAAPGAGYQIGDEPGVAGAVFGGDDGARFQAGVAGECGFDLADLDAETAHLHLAVGATDQLQHHLHRYLLLLLTVLPILPCHNCWQVVKHHHHLLLQWRLILTVNKHI